MQVKAESRFVRLSADKARDIARRMRGLSVAEALKVTDFSERKAAFEIGKTLKTAIANAEENAKLSVDELRVKEVLVDAGPTSRRYWARARGMAGPILRRTCHVRIVLTDGRDET